MQNEKIFFCFIGCALTLMAYGFGLLIGFEKGKNSKDKTKNK